MDLNKELEHLTINVIKDTVFIQNKKINFSYTAVKKLIKEEFQEQYRYFGGLQCNFENDSDDYKVLENKLCDIAESILKNF